jgi:hypothetical protein
MSKNNDEGQIAEEGIIIVIIIIIIIIITTTTTTTTTRNRTRKFSLYAHKVQLVS